MTNWPFLDASAEKAGQQGSTAAEPTAADYQALNKDSEFATA